MCGCLDFDVSKNSLGDPGFANIIFEPYIIGTQNPGFGPGSAFASSVLQQAPTTKHIALAVASNEITSSAKPSRDVASRERDPFRGTLPACVGECQNNAAVIGSRLLQRRQKRCQACNLDNVLCDL